MANSFDEDLRTPEEGLEASYYLAYTSARDALREGTHPDAVRLTLLLADEPERTPSSPVVAAQWRGLEDALAGRPPSPPSFVGMRGWRTWRVDQRPRTR
jgi:hypothetical protein